MARSQRNPAPTHLGARLALLFGLGLGAGATAACQPDPVGEPTAERYEACLVGYECAVECPSPEEALTELGCSEGDFTSEAPNCALTNNCANAKADCFTNCEEMFPGSPPPQPQRDCKIQCDVDFGNNSTCIDDFQDWLDEREGVLMDYRTCLSPCEGRPSRNDCDDGELGACDPVQGARHKAVSQVETCTLEGGDACEWTCEDPSNNYYIDE